jgi:SCY1-like protein 2
VYDEIGKIADKEIIATEIMPQLWRMSFGPLLNLEQFSKFMKTIHDLTDRVEEAHMSHLKEVKSLEDQTRSVSASGSPQVLNQPNIGETEMSFESLVQGNATSAKVSQDDMFSSSNTLEWTSAPTMKTPTLTPSTATNGWSPKPAMATTSTNNNQWSQSPMYQQQQPSSMPTLSNPPSYQSQPIKPIQTPPMNAMANLSMNNNTSTMHSQNTFSSSMNTMNSRNTLNSSMNTMSPMNSMNKPMNTGGNYDALRGYSSNTLTPQTTMAPLNPSMGLLKPTSATRSNTNSPSQPKINLHAFDPLG